MTLDRIAREFFETLFETLEEALPLGWDIDWDGHVLTINKENSSFLLNFHAPTQEIWLSSPASGAHHFIYRNAEWVCTRSGFLIPDVLQSDFAQLEAD